MRLYPTRLTTRRMMTWVAIAALSLSIAAIGPGWAERRKKRFEQLALMHSSKGRDFIPIDSPSHERRRRWHEALGRKYRFATEWPILPVWPDPPEPR
jgi:hypothetical protein